MQCLARAMHTDLYTLCIMRTLQLTNHR